MPHQGPSTHESAPPLKGTPPYSCFEGERRTRAEHLLENGHENILFRDEAFFTIEEQYNSQNNKIYAHTSLEVHSEGAGMLSPFLRHGLVGGVPLGDDTPSFLQERCENWCPSVST